MNVEVCHSSFSQSFQNTVSVSHLGENDTVPELIISRVSFWHSMCALNIRFSACKYDPYIPNLYRTPSYTITLKRICTFWKFSFSLFRPKFTPAVPLWEWTPVAEVMMQLRMGGNSLCREQSPDETPKLLGKNEKLIFL